MSDALEALELHPVRIPMRQRFRRVDHREAVLVKGPRGWGEFSPFPDYPPEVTTRWLAAALELSCGQLPDPVRPVIPVNVTVPAIDTEAAVALVEESGATTAKVKIADREGSEDEDVERVAAVREALGPQGNLRVDVNASWDLETAIARIERLDQYDLQYVEQPVATLEDMKALRARVPVPLAADELVRQSPHPLRVIEEGAADVLILKVQPMGGVSRSRSSSPRRWRPRSASTVVCWRRRLSRTSPMPVAWARCHSSKGTPRSIPWSRSTACSRSDALSPTPIYWSDGGRSVIEVPRCSASCAPPPRS